MVARAAALLVIATSSVAFAQPDQCTVRIAAAPDEVRAVIDAWVAEEPRCLRELEVRVDQTANGLHLEARDSSGQVRERVVPDAQSAAVLIVSWMADDSVIEPEPDPAVDTEAPSQISLAPLGIDAELPPRIDGEVLAVHRHEDRRWLALGMIGTKQGGGVRAQADLVVEGPFVLGVTASAQGTADDKHRDHMAGPPPPAAGMATAKAFVAATHSFGRVTFRAQLGFGAELVATKQMDGSEHRSIAPAFDAALLAQVPFGKRWGLVGGPVIDMPLDHDDRAGVAAFFGVQYGR